MGTYCFIVKEHEFGESTQKVTHYVEFRCTPVTPGDDVDMDALNLVTKWNEKTMRATFYLTDDSMFRLKDFLQHCGLDTDGHTLGELIPETTNAMFSGYVEHTVSNKDNETIFANIGSTAPAE